MFILLNWEQLFDTSVVHLSPSNPVHQFKRLFRVFFVSQCLTRATWAFGKYFHIVWSIHPLSHSLALSRSLNPANVFGHSTEVIMSIDSIQCTWTGAPSLSLAAQHRKLFQANTPVVELYQNSILFPKPESSFNSIIEHYFAAGSFVDEEVPYG